MIDLIFLHGWRYLAFSVLIFEDLYRRFVIFAQVRTFVEFDNLVSS